MIKERKGTFKVSRKLIDDALQDPTSILKVFADVVIVRAEMIYMEDTIQYWGYSPKFELCDPTVEAPSYIVTVHVAGWRPEEQEPPKTWHEWTKV